MAQTGQADTIISARWIAPVEGPSRLLDNHALVIRDGRIIDIQPSAQASATWKAAEIVTLPDHLITPGLVNAHTHAAMTLFRGLADDLPLMTWLEEHIWPAEQRWVSESFVAHGTSLAALEMIRSGTTCFGDMYFFPDVIARTAREAGLRAVIFSPVLDFPTPMGEGPDDYLHLALQAADHWRHDALINIGFGPHAPYTVSDEPLLRLLSLAEELDLPVMMHVHETLAEVSASQERPLARLDRLGALSPRFLAVHMTRVTDEEIPLLCRSGAHVVHCPESNLKLASGFCPAERLRQAGVNVALGTDGPASNNDLDMLGEMRTAALLGKAVSGTASAMPADAILTMATLNGARALGLEQQIGSLAVGKQADIIAIDLRQPETMPVYDPIAQLVYSTTRQQVTHSWVAGRCLMSERRMRHSAESRILAEATEWQQRIMEARHA